MKRLLLKLISVASAITMLGSMALMPAGSPVAPTTLSASAVATSSEVVSYAASFVGKSKSQLGISGVWCAAFATKCLIDKGISIPTPNRLNCTNLVYGYMQAGRFHGRLTNSFKTTQPENGSVRTVSSSDLAKVKDLNYEPKPGDLIIYDWYDEGPEHVGIVYEAQGTTVTKTIEGNRGGSDYVQVIENPHISTIFGYCSPAYGSSTVTPPTPPTPVEPTPTFSALNHSRPRAVEEADAKIGKKYDTSIAFINEVLAKAKAHAFSGDNTIRAQVAAYVKNGAYHSTRNNFTESCGTVSAATLNSTYRKAYTPRPGDVAVLETDNNFGNGPDRLAIVGCATNSGISTGIQVIEVDITSKQVCTRTYTNTSKIWGYCSPFYSASDMGDLNQDGAINRTDLSAFKKAAYKTTSVYQRLCMDFSGNGATNSTDYNLFNKKIVDIRRYEGEGTLLSHAVGHLGPDKDCWVASTDKDKAGHMIFGPYKTGISAGLKTADFRLMIDNNSADNSRVAGIDVFDATTQTVLASREILRKDFNFAFGYQNFQLHFKQSSATHKLEFRVYYTGNSALFFDKVLVTSNKQVYQAESTAMSHALGFRAEKNTCWQAAVEHGKGHMTFGPYENGIPVGKRKAAFRLKIDNNSADNGQVAALDVFDATTQKTLGSMEIFRKDFLDAEAYQFFYVDFTCPDASHDLEFRVNYLGNSRLSLDWVKIK